MTTENKKPMNVLAVGIGGQGIIKLSDILSEVTFRAGYDAKKSEIHGLSQRGGSVTGHIRWSDQVFTPVIPDGEADCLLALEELEALRYAHMVNPNGIILVNDFRMYPVTVVTGASEYPADLQEQLEGYAKVKRVPATALAAEMGNIRMTNIIMLGAFSNLTPEIPTNIWHEVIRDFLPAKVVDKNLEAFEKGRAL